jgi:hypothetical protein
MANEDPAATPAAPVEQAAPVPGAYIPTDEVPDVPPLKPSKYPLSSAPLPEGVTPENIQKQTPAISSPDMPQPKTRQERQEARTAETTT